MVATLSGLSSLKGLSLEFKSSQSLSFKLRLSQSHPDVEGRNLPPKSRSILPVLAKFYFYGVAEYLEKLVTCIDNPHLDELDITFINRSNSDFPQLARFINCTPTLKEPDEAHLMFSHLTADVAFRSRTSKCNFYDIVSCRGQELQLSSIKPLCNSSLWSLSMAEDLYIENCHFNAVWDNYAFKNTACSELLL